MKVARNLNELAKLLKPIINDVMKNDVAKVARNTLKEHIIEDVYDAYTSPAKNPYQRTGELYQDENILTEMQDNNTLFVRSIREEDGRDIAYIIESGRGYSWEDSEIYKTEQERPFHENTAEELEVKGLARDALIKGLQKQGLKIKK